MEDMLNLGYNILSSAQNVENKKDSNKSKPFSVINVSNYAFFAESPQPVQGSLDGC